jgi:hypothetical protein
MNKYYVYRHIRLDSNTPFYIGKGSGNRAFDFIKRNGCWKKIAKKHGVKTEIVLNNIDEKTAFDMEIKLISLYKKFNYCEANLTNGGEGGSGYKHTEQAKQIMREKRKGENNNFFGKQHSEETKEKIKEARKKQIITEEAKLKISKATIGENNPMFGKKHSEETKKKIRDKRLGKYTGKNSPLFGIPKSEETKRKLSITTKKYYEKNGSHRSRPVINIETGEVYKSIREAAKMNGYDERYLNKHLTIRKENKTPIRFMD